ncbi:MAG: NAD(P)/FAD-dependent oxidoreductase [Aestuariivirga sp.]|uniref:NAD(P)/FAD-dependent oxidoreductase n=1 Tax=Aestuariivirga sp. TaxID=2650926 RepID=UPI0038D11B34
MTVHPDPDSLEAAAWLATLEAALSRQDATAAARLFGEECYWRDLVALTWNIRTVEGRDGLADMLRATLPRAQPRGFTLTEPASRNGDALEAWFRFETDAGRGTGHLRLRNGLGYTILTTLQELKGHEEKSGVTRERGLEHGAQRGRRTWTDLRRAEQAELGISRQPYVLIIGGGQGGIALGARLKRLGVPALIIEKNARAGDSWRNRYRSLVLHDPVWYDHLPYIPFPDHWPVFTPKDKMGDWLEAYVTLMELNYWTSAEVTGARFDEASQDWSVEVTRQGQTLTLRPRHLVFATGSYGPPRELRPPGAETFAGVQYHSSKHVSGEPFRGKRCVVVGANSSAHDVCADFWEHEAAEVTMIQRTPTTVVRSESLMEIAFAPIYSQEAAAKGIDVDKADMIFASVPFRLMADLQRPVYAEIAARDADLIGRLNAQGFMTDYGPDGSGLMMKALRTGSGYYLDVGCSDIIASGGIKVKPRAEIARLTGDAAILTDGSEVKADVIVYATGYLPMNEWVAKIVSREAADLIGPNWGYGSGTRGDPGPWEGELRNMWKPLRHPNLWFHGGNLHLSRFNSKFVALQLKARFEGMETPVY